MSVGESALIVMLESERVKCFELEHQRQKLLDLVSDLQIENNRLKKSLGEKPSKHGRTGYTNGCRCGICCDAAREYQAMYRAKRKNISG